MFQSVENWVVCPNELDGSLLFFLLDLSNWPWPVQWFHKFIGRGRHTMQTNRTKMPLYIWSESIIVCGKKEHGYWPFIYQNMRLYGHRIVRSISRLKNSQISIKIMSNETQAELKGILRMLNGFCCNLMGFALCLPLALCLGCMGNMI